MSATGSLMIRNLKSKNDYAKAVITQDDLLRVAIANQNNISTARKELKDGIAPSALPQTQKTSLELQQDLGLQESTAIQNLSQLFKYTEVSTIVARLTSDEIFVLNQSFPAIKKDLENKFDLKLLTPTFFIDYLKKYIEELNESKGVSTNLSNMTNKFNQLTTEIRDIQNYLPSNVLLIQLHRDLQTLGPLPTLQPIMDRLIYLADNIPTKADYLALQDKTDVDRNDVLARLQTITSDMPTQQDIMLLHNGIINNTLPKNTALQQVEDLVNSMNNRQLAQLEEIKREIGSTPRGRTPRGQATSGLSSDINFDYILDNMDFLPPNTEELGIGRINNRGKEFVFIKEAGGDWARLEGDALQKAYVNNYQFKLWCNGNFSKKPSMSELKYYIRTNGYSVKTGGISSQTLPSTSDVLSGLASRGSSPRSTTSSRAVSSTNPTTQSDASVTTTGYGLMGKAIYSGARPVKRVVFGKGIDLEREPLYKTFGKFIVNIPTLKERDVLHLKYPSLSRIPEFPPKPVSEDFRDFFLDTIDNGKLNHKLLKTLDEEEKSLFERITEKAGLFKGLGLTKQPNKEDEEEVNRFNILRGEYYAGNNSHQLLDELRKLIIKFIHKGRIQRNEGLQILSQLC
jgi:hypothetical protein